MKKEGRYFLSRVSRGDKGQINFESVGALTSEKLAEYRECIKSVAEYFGSQNVVMGLLGNVNDVMIAVDQLVKAYANQPTQAESIMEQASVQIARHFANTCSLFRSFLDHFDRYFVNIHGKESEAYSGWKSCQAKEYDAGLSYKLVYMMRNYIQHYDMPPLSVRIVDSADKPEFQVVVNVSIAEMRKDRGFDKKLNSSERAMEHISLTQVLNEWGISLGNIINYANRFRLESALPSCQKIMDIRSHHHVRGQYRMAIIMIPADDIDPNKLDIQIEWLSEERADAILKQDSSNKKTSSGRIGKIIEGDGQS